jgi:hypothetical protein
MGLKWLEGIKNNLFRFILRTSEKKFEYFRYSLSGDLYGPGVHWGLGQLVFATKILYMIDKLKDIDEEKRKNLGRAILSFQKSNGYIHDPFISKLTWRARVKGFLKNGNLESLLNTRVKRAETRQSFAALFCLGEKPKKPFLHIPYTKEAIHNYLQSLDWQQPWASGSHFSHLLFFLHYNKELFGLHSDETKRLIDYAIEWVNKLQSSVDGCWYRGEATNSQKVNGAMKILTGLSASGRSLFSYPEKIIDTALKIAKGSDACNDFNVVYVLYCCSKVVDYRSEDIKNFCLRRLSQYRRYYHRDSGGFSFKLDKANDVYYGAKITKGLNEPDIHGTTMFLWGITLISKILKLDLGLREPII